MISAAEKAEELEERAAIQGEPRLARPAEQGLKLIDAAYWLQTEPPPPDQIIEDLFDAGDKAVVIAASKLRKSFFAEQLALAVAAKKEFLGWRIPRCRRVLYVQFEIREHHSHRRTRGLARAMGINPEDLGGRLLILPGRGLGLAGTGGLKKIQRAAAGFRPEVIILDPLYKLAQGVENAAEDFKILLSAFDVLAEETGAAIIYVHHDAKGSPGDRDIRDRGAGSNVLGRDYDACLTLTAHAQEPDAAVVEVLLRNYPPQDPFVIEWAGRNGGYCFEPAEDLAAEKKTSQTKPLPPTLESYLPVAKSILSTWNEVEIPFFKAKFKEAARVGDNKVRDFLAWATNGPNAPLRTREERGYKVHRKFISLSGQN